VAVPKVLIPSPYRGPTRGEEELVVDAATVRGAIEAVEKKFPGFAPQVFDAHGKLHRFVRLFVNGELVDPKHLDRALASGDELEIVAAIAGG
jgi:molybdopterin converting factor small subunit